MHDQIPVMKDFNSYFNMKVIGVEPKTSPEGFEATALHGYPRNGQLYTLALMAIITYFKVRTAFIVVD